MSSLSHERNEIEQNTQVAIAQKNFEATQLKLDIEKNQRFATLVQQQEIALREAEQQAQVVSTQRAAGNAEKIKGRRPLQETASPCTGPSLFPAREERVGVRGPAHSGCRPVPSTRARQKARQPASPRPRTRSSNPVPSSGESVANSVIAKAGPRLLSAAGTSGFAIRMLRRILTTCGPVAPPSPPRGWGHSGGNGAIPTRSRSLPGAGGSL